MEYILDERGVHEDVGDGEIGGADYHVYGGILSSRGHERDEWEMGKQGYNRRMDGIDWQEEGCECGDWAGMLNRCVDTRTEDSDGINHAQHWTEVVLAAPGTGNAWDEEKGVRDAHQGGMQPTNGFEFVGM